MPSNHFLIFALTGAKYGVDVTLVDEVFRLPEITPVAQAPHDVVGILNLRGDVVTIIDLNARLGYKRQEVGVDHRVVIVRGESGRRAGFIVDEVFDVMNFRSEALSSPPDYGLRGRASLYVGGVARSAEEMYLLLDAQQLLVNSEGLHKQILELNESLRASNELEESLPHDNPVFLPGLKEEERNVIRQRARDLAHEPEDENQGAETQVAMARLAQEYIGLPLDNVIEFNEVFNRTRIPCCPPHIAGSMNLRGEILVLIDLRTVLGLPPGKLGEQVVVVRHGDRFCGLLVDEILDIVPLRDRDRVELPPALRDAGSHYLIGACSFEGGAAALLDVRRLLESDRLVVDAAV